MKMMDCVEVIVEKPQYAKEGVHKGMQGWICLDNGSNQSWLVNFPQCGEKDDIAEIVIKEEDLKEIPVMYAKVNEQIKARFDSLVQEAASISDEDNTSFLEGNRMKEMDCVEVIVEKDQYAKEGVHKGMQGWICDPRCIQDCWLVDFPQCGEKDGIAMIPIREEDLKEIPVMYAKVNEQIKAQFDNLVQEAASISDEDDTSFLI